MNLFKFWFSEFLSILKSNTLSTAIFSNSWDYFISFKKECVAPSRCEHYFFLNMITNIFYCKLVNCETEDFFFYKCLFVTLCTKDVIDLEDMGIMMIYKLVINE